MNSGPTQRLLQRARSWANDVEELGSLQWQLFTLEWDQCRQRLLRSVVWAAVAIGCAAIGIPLALVAGLIWIAQALQVSTSAVLTLAGAALVVGAAACWLVARRAWLPGAWFPRSRRQLSQNLKAVFAGQGNHRDADDDYELN